MKQVGYIGIDQYGGTYQIQKHPLKELCKQLGRTSAQKMYRDTTGGTAKHVGYVIGGHWIEVFTVCEWKGKT